MSAIDFETSESPKTVNNVVWTYANSVWTPSSQAGLIPIYSSVSAVNAISNPVDGQQALALISGDTANAYYYIYKGGWFRAGVANLNPTISSDINAAYLLGAGDTLTLSISATDPEGVPLTYSLTNNLGNVGTVDQTNLQSGSVVVTASSNEAHAGSGTIQFHISDGVNTANSVLATLTLNFLSIHWKHVALSTKTGSTNNGSNTTFTDLSSTNRSVTKTSNPYQGAFSPYGDCFSMKFDGSDDRLVTPSISLTGQFTVEGWFFTDGSGWIFQSQDSAASSGNNGMRIALASNGYIAPQVYIGGSFSASGAINSGGSTDLRNQWNHFAITRNSSNLITVWVNGQSVVSSTTSVDFSGPFIVGASLDGGSYNTYFAGYISNFRVKTTCEYTSAFNSTSTITAPEPFSSDSSTLLLLNKNRFFDASSNNTTVTINSKPQIQKFSPFPDIIYDPAAYYGSIFFDGSDDYLTISNVDLSGVFTISFWMYQSGTGYRVFQVGDEYINGENNAIMVFCYHTGVVSVNVHVNGTYVWQKGVSASTSKKFGFPQWAYVHMSRDSSNYFRFFVNGEEFDRYSGYTGAISADFTNNIRVANQKSNNTIQTSGEWHGYISDLRVTNTYIASATPPTSPVGTSNTKLYLPGNGAQIYDQSGHSHLTLVGNTTTRTFPFDSANLLVFDGTNTNRITTAVDSDFHSTTNTNLTIEGWYYFDTFTNGGQLFDFRTSSNHSAPFLWVDDSVGGGGTNKLRGYNWQGSTAIYSTNALSLNTWYHMAFVKAGTTGKVYLNGVEEISWSDTTGLAGEGFVTVGARYTAIGSGSSYYAMNGYVSNFRVSNVIRYANATAALAYYNSPSAFASDSYTSLLINSGLTDSSSNSHTITNNGVSSITQKFPGVNPIYFDGSGDYIQLPSISEIPALSNTGSWTIEMFFRPDSSIVSSTYDLFNSYSATGTGLSIRHQAGSPARFLIVPKGDGSNGIVDSTNVTANADWHHIALCYSGTVMTLFLDGTQIAQSTTTISIQTTQRTTIGNYWYYSNSTLYNQFKGYISDFQILATEKYTANFTVPAAAFTRIIQ